MIIIIIIIVILIIPFPFFPLGCKLKQMSETNNSNLFNRVNPQTYTQIHTPSWFKGEGTMEPLPKVFDHDNLQYFETILPSVESL